MSDSYQSAARFINSSNNIKRLDEQLMDITKVAISKRIVHPNINDEKEYAKNITTFLSVLRSELPSESNLNRYVYELTLLAIDNEKIANGQTQEDSARNVASFIKTLTSRLSDL